ncbi:MYXO-CTERM sorting domain-containing protein [Parafrigoribacterium soli]|uniref:MYXO-CTERM sorting domain-containing protein n=1 Tax=Parafrigoribacterium soli TaxID=3144663 RepID=UPI0032EBFBCD
MLPVDAFASCAYAVPVCNDTNSSVFLAGDNAWIGMPILAAFIAVILIVVLLRRRRR